jgi:hypothetical protein
MDAATHLGQEIDAILECSEGHGAGKRYENLQSHVKRSFLRWHEEIVAQLLRDETFAILFMGVEAATYTLRSKVFEVMAATLIRYALSIESQGSSNT